MKNYELNLRPFPKDLKKILFVCTGNICRSVSAAAFLSHLFEKAGLEIEVHSAGIATFDGKKASPKTLQLLSQQGIDFNHHRSRKITPEIIADADLIFVMEKNHRSHLLQIEPLAEKKLFMLSDFYPRPETFPRDSNIPDPYGMDDFFYMNVNEMIKQCCEMIFNQLKKETAAISGRS